LLVRNHCNQPVDGFIQPVWEYAVPGMGFRVGDPSMRYPHVFFRVVVIDSVAILKTNGSY
jgi:hypothetical protein